ncbi:MAG: chorismate mutase [Roseococcus sp.]|nr:chorismate mutase [Roseococcus sp.]
MSQAPTTEDSLEALRREIDRLDDALHDLLMRRAEVVHRLAQSAAKPAGTTLRPGREAAILRRLLARHAGPLPRAVLVRLWREIFAASIAQQAPFAVALAGEPGLARLAAAHFGLETPLRQHPTTAAALAAVLAREAAIAVLPWPRENGSEAEAWWTRLDGQTLHVIARLPFLAEHPPALEAAVLALYPADASGRDAALWRAQRPGTPDRASLAAAFPGARLLAVHRAGGTTQALLETEGAALPDALPLGRYAIPEGGAPRP